MVEAANHPIQFRVRGMDCAEEVTALKQALVPLVGDENRLAFDLLHGRLTVKPGQPAVTEQQVLTGIQQAGLKAELWTADDGPPTASNSASSLRFWLVVASGLAIVLALASHVGWVGSLTAALGGVGEGEHTSPPLVACLLYVVAIGSGIWLVLPKAWNSARHLRPDMNLLMVIAVCGAVLIGEWLEAATVAFLFALSILLEAWSIGRARRAIAQLLDLTPPEVRVKRPDNSEVLLPPSQVGIGTRFVVRPGERIALDGRVIAGSSHVNQAPITGESQLVAKTVGEAIYAGTINGDGAIEAESTAAAQDTTLARIIRLVEEAQSSRAASEQWVERFARVYTPAVLVLAVLAWLIPPLLVGRNWFDSTYSALTLLVIACPCALVISTPVSIVAGLTAAARRGVLIKGGIFLEVPARLAAIAFDKTGTLTRGEPAVVSVTPLGSHDEKELLERAAALEAQSDHPLARAVIAYAGGKGIRPEPAGDLQTVQGKGATATIQGRRFWIGSHKYLEERGQETPEVHELLERLSSEGRSVVVVGNDQHVCGFLTVADAVRPQARPTLDELRSLGIKHLVLLTGDNSPTARSLAAQVGIDEIHAELLPQDKVTQIKRLVERYGQVAMVGDGINDAPALAQSSLGIAMGAAGSDAAIETADIALLADDLTALPWLVRHSRNTMSIIRQNITFSLAIKALFVALTFAGWSSLWAAIAADTGASLLVVINGLRLLQSDVQQAGRLTIE
jgi:Cd2+/Zn2+-exporting ATPase